MNNAKVNQTANELANQRVYVDSNLVENPNCFQQYQYHESIFRDFTLFILSKKHDRKDKTLHFHLAEFYDQFNLSKASLFNPINKELHKAAKAHGFENIPTVIEWVIFKLNTQPLSFISYRSKNNAHIQQSAKEGGRQVNVNLVRLLVGKSYHIGKGREGTNPTIDIEPRVLMNSRGDQYIPFLLSDYLRLVTLTGRPDQNARKLFLRMCWKESITASKKALSSTENFVKLCDIANIKGPVRNKASKLRDLLDKIYRETTLTSRWEVKKEGAGYVVNVYKD